jgi:hypothetical protein
MSEVQFPHRRSHGLQRRGADRRVEAPEQCVVSGASNQPGPKAVSEEVELNVRIRAFALPVLAVNDLGFRRMHLQAALRQPCLKLRLESLSFLLVSAVDQPIVCIPTPRKVWVRPCPWRQQAILGRRDWDADAPRDIVRDYVIEHLADDDAVLVIDETGFLRQGKASCGVARQYTGSAGKITNCQIGVFAAYVSRHGHALIDRALYLPQEWTDDPTRLKAAYVPPRCRLCDQIKACDENDCKP